MPISRWGKSLRLACWALESAVYLDLLSNNLRRQQNSPVRFDGELGRIYVDNQATCVIEDPLLRRRIRIEKYGRLSTAVWNPWALTADKMDDLGLEGWRNMVCVESANALGNQVTLVAEASHSTNATYSAEKV